MSAGAVSSLPRPVNDGHVTVGRAGMWGQAI